MAVLDIVSDVVYLLHVGHAFILVVDQFALNGLFEDL